MQVDNCIMSTNLLRFFFPVAKNRQLRFAAARELELPPNPVSRYNFSLEEDSANNGLFYRQQRRRARKYWRSGRLLLRRVQRSINQFRISANGAG